ncbi:hypothetical protein NX059_006483 [Neofusicoccum parvum]|uniref:Uncharacterized protein n=1 Tax=Neofusicoccum parvum TaxID=310453 RepID=A0ACB5SCV9_9PEZI|nr:hypothetical protein NX059_006483 [Neofusicoccum parvum]GME53057.1 hypothetical protein NX059_006483 [Neofusicoccum parvum]
MSTKTTIAIAGITSKLAIRVVSSLLKRPDVLVRGSCRSTSKLPSFIRVNPRVSLIQAGPYDTEALRRLVSGCNAVVCCYYADNETMTSGQKLLVDLCEEEGVPRYLASDYTSDYRNLDEGEGLAKEPMKHVLAYLLTKKRVKGVHILIGLLMETWWSFCSGWDIENMRFTVWGTGDEKWDITSYQTAAEYVAAVALDSSAVGVLKFLGERKSTREIARTMESIYGVKPSLESIGSMEECEKRRWGDGQDALIAAAAYFCTGKGSLGEDLDNLRYPEIKPETFEDFFKSRDITKLSDDDFAIALK